MLTTYFKIIRKSLWENKETGEVIEADSALQLSKKIGIHFSVIHEELNRHTYSRSPKPRGKTSKYYDFLQNHKIYYKESRKSKFTYL